MTIPVSKSRVEIPHRCSRVLIFLYCSAFAMFLIAFLFVNVNLIARAISMFFAFAGAWQIWKQVRFLMALEIIVVYEGRIDLCCGDEVLSSHVIGSSFVSEFFVAFTSKSLGVKNNSDIRYLVLLPDSVSKQDHHFMRLMLKQGKLKFSA